MSEPLDVNPSLSSSSPFENRSGPVRIGDLDIDYARHQISLQGNLLNLSGTEFDLLAHLARATPRVVSPQELAALAQGYQVESLQEANATLRYHFYRLRRKIKQATGRDDLIKTVHGVGYTLSQPLKSDLPAGLITFLFTDIESSTELWEQYPVEMKASLAQHDRVLREIIERYGGHIFKRVGDMFCIAFSSPEDALTTTLVAQRVLHSETWATPVPLRVRMGLNTGPAESREGDYFGLTLNQLSRMLAAGYGGQMLLSASTRAQVARHLPAGIELRDLGPRRLKGLKELAHIYQILVPDLPGRFPRLKTLDSRPTNLPGQMTSFVGREWETRQISQLLRRSDVRLLTLLGVGGAGKTRLSLQVAENLLDEFQDGVFFVPLAPLQTTDQVGLAIAHAVQLIGDGTRPVLDSLSEGLRSRQTLLVLDNFEHLLDAAPIVTALLQAAPYVKVLATSRQALEVYGENSYPVAPMTAPDPRERLTMGQLERYEATKLFVERAVATRPHFAFTDSDATVIAEICACLDGLPLAIELAAARIPQFTLTDLAAQLTSRLGFLSTGPRDLPARHRTLRGLLDWSYYLLTASEQALFARLAVFEGGWSPNAAEAVALWARDERQLERQLLEGLAAKYLIQPTQGTPEQTRFTMLGTIREYARERLDANDELETVRARHAEYFLSELERVEPELIGGARQQYALWMCEVEQQNFRAALQWALEKGIVAHALRMVKALWRFWSISSQLSEGRRWVEQVLSVSADAPAPLRAPVLYGLGKLAMFQADYAAAQRASENALELYRQLDDREGMGWSLNALGEIAYNQKDYARANALLEASLELHRVVGSPLGMAKALDDLGRLALSGQDYPRATQLLQQSLKLRRERGSAEGVAVGLVTLGEVLRLQGEYAQAEQYTHESLARYRQLNHTAGIVTCLDNLAQMRLAQQDPRQAIALYMEALGLLRDMELDENGLTLACLSGLALAFAALGEFLQSARVLGVYEHVAEMGMNESEASEIESPAHMAIRPNLPPKAWSKLIAEGRAMMPEDLLYLFSHEMKA